MDLIINIIGMLGKGTLILINQGIIPMNEEDRKQTNEIVNVIENIFQSGDVPKYDVINDLLKLRL